MHPRRSLFPFLWRAGLVGAVLTASLALASLSSLPWRAFGLYGVLLSLFHLSEFATIAYIKPRSLKPDSFLLNHSREYHVAAVASWIEFVVEALLFPGFKSCIWLTGAGVAVCLAGEVLRKGAMLTAGNSFSHTVEFRKERGHVLVTRGLYSWCRHPSYVGWFFWCIGTQVVLLNPVCVIAYALAAHEFFRHRIRDEEQILIEFFGEDYVEYRKRVPCGIPFLQIE